MAYTVSQLRKQVGQNTYMTNIDVTPSTIISPSRFDDQKTFVDFALASSTDDKIKIFEYGKVYYLRFQIHRIPQYFYSGSKSISEVSMYGNDADTLILQILLKNSEENDEQEVPPQIIGNCTVSTINYQEDEKYSSYSFVFSPTRNYDRLGFRIQRVSFDAINDSSPRNWLISNEPIKQEDQKTEEDGKIVISGKRYTGQIQNGNYVQIDIRTKGDRIIFSGAKADVCELHNLVNPSFPWLKFGYQCRPGSLIVVNGEPIRLGRSGIYEINNGTIIESFMIASPGGSDNSKIDAFLLDYAYNGN